MKKGERMSDELKEKIRQSNLGRKHNITDIGRLSLKKHSIGGWNKGLKCSDEWKEKLRLANTGKKHSEETKLKMALSAKIGSANNKWRDNNVGYRALHYWVERHLKKPIFCEHCGCTGKMHWANKSHEYKRDITDWIRLCPKCHRKYDKEFTAR